MITPPLSIWARPLLVAQVDVSVTLDPTFLAVVLGGTRRSARQRGPRPHGGYRSPRRPIIARGPPHAAREHCHDEPPCGVLFGRVGSRSVLVPPVESRPTPVPVRSVPCRANACPGIRSTSSANWNAPWSGTSSG